MYTIPIGKIGGFHLVSIEIEEYPKSKNRCGAETFALLQCFSLTPVSFVKLSGLVRCRVGEYSPVLRTAADTNR